MKLLTPSQVPLVTCHYQRAEEGCGAPQREGGHGGERVASENSAEAGKKKQDRAHGFTPTCPVKPSMKNKSVHMEILYGRHVPTALFISYNNPQEDIIPILHRRKRRCSQDKWAEVKQLVKGRAGI